MTFQQCHKPAGNSRRLEREIHSLFGVRKLESLGQSHKIHTTLFPVFLTQRQWLTDGWKAYSSITLGIALLCCS